MKGKSIAAIAIVSAMFLSSCQKDDLNISPQPFPARIEKITMDDDLLKLNYDAGGRVSSVTINDQFRIGNPNMELAVTYDASSRVTRLSNGTDYTITPFYENNELTKAEARDGSNELIYVTNYEYLNGFLKSAVVKTNDGAGGLTNSLKFIFTYDGNGNVSKTQLFMGNIWGTDWLFTGSREYTYDNKINPLKNVKTILQILLQNISNNNVVTDKGLDAGGEVLDTQTFTYTYNSSNLPVSAVVQISEVGSTPVSKQLRYTYKP